MNESFTAVELNARARANLARDPAWVDAVSLLLWIVAGAAAFLPFAFDTSPWNAVTFHVPGNQGNWWHALVGAPFFLAFPMIWLRFCALFRAQKPGLAFQRLIWIAAGSSIGGTVLVELPFLLHLAGTSEWQRLSVLSLGFGIVMASAITMIVRRRNLSPMRACIASIDTAYLANAALCLVVYAEASGGASSRSGWMVTSVIVWPMALELVWQFVSGFRRNC